MRTELPPKKTGKAGRPRGSFTQAKRLDRLRALLEQSPAGITVEELAEFARCSDRTVRRYLGELQRQLDLESFEPAHGEPWRWRIKPSEQSRAVAMRRTHAYSLLATKPIFAPLRGSALAEEVEVVNRELLKVAHRATKRGVRGEVRGDTRLEERFICVPTPFRTYPPKQLGFIDELFHAAANLVAVEASARDEQGDLASGLYHPYAIVLHDGAVHVIGQFVGGRRTGVTPLARFEHVATKSGSSFTLPNDFEVGAYLDGYLGLAEGKPVHDVVVDFDASVTDEVRHLVASRAQRVGMWKTRGGIRIRFGVVRLEHALRWVLRFGAAATVVSPPALAEAVLREARALAARYERRAERSADRGER
jgi:predicted DNA-binding transcriptional regulator YafY